MHVRSLALRTEIMFAAMDGEVVDRGDYVVARTPSNPTFFWGNFIILPSAPSVSECEPGGRWVRAFQREFPEAKHLLVAWDEPHAEAFDAKPFAPLGFVPDETSLLRFADATPRASAWEPRHLRDDEWDAAFALLDRAMTPLNDSADGYKRFLRIQVERYRRLVARGLGAWFGVFEGGALVGTCGVFSHDGLCRFQTVAVDQTHRRRGICSALVDHVVRHAQQRWPSQPILIGAAPASAAERIYLRAGFEPIEHTVALLFTDKQNTPARPGSRRTSG